MRFEDLDVWKRAARLSTAIYQSLAGCRDLGYKDQTTRSALSVACNIAEGYELESNRDRVKFLNYAKGSCGELRTQIYIGMEVGFIHREVGQGWVEKTKELSKMIYSLMKTLRDSANNTR